MVLEPARYFMIPKQLGNSVRCGPVGPALEHIGAVRDELLGHRDIPPSCRDVQRCFALIAPCQIGICAVLEQPLRTARVSGPKHHIYERRHAARNAIHVDAVTMQQVERGKIAPAAGDVYRDAIRWIRARVKQGFRKREVIDGTD